MSLKTNDAKSEEFRKYLESHGVIESLTKVFVRLVKERPEKPLEFLNQYLLTGIDTYEDLQSQVSQANSEVAKLRDIIKSINPQLLENIDKEKLAKQELNISNGHNEDMTEKPRDNQINEQSTSPENKEQDAVKKSQVEKDVATENLDSIDKNLN